MYIKRSSFPVFYIFYYQLYKHGKREESTYFKEEKRDHERYNILDTFDPSLNPNTVNQVKSWTKGIAEDLQRPETR